MCEQENHLTFIETCSWIIAIDNYGLGTGVNKHEYNEYLICSVCTIKIDRSYSSERQLIFNVSLSAELLATRTNDHDNPRLCFEQESIHM